jgi:hypothetical protein
VILSTPRLQVRHHGSNAAQTSQRPTAAHRCTWPTPGVTGLSPPGRASSTPAQASSRFSLLGQKRGRSAARAKPTLAEALRTPPCPRPGRPPRCSSTFPRAFHHLLSSPKRIHICTLPLSGTPLPHLSCLSCLHPSFDIPLLLCYSPAPDSIHSFVQQGLVVNSIFSATLLTFDTRLGHTLYATVTRFVFLRPTLPPPYTYTPCPTLVTWPSILLFHFNSAPAQHWMC